MTSAFDPVDDPGGFELDFSYATWTPGTAVTLCNVPWDMGYRNVVWYKSDEACFRDIIADGRNIEITAMTYCAHGRPVRIPTSFTDASKYNYCVVRNGREGGARPKMYFYFITSVEYVAPGTTQITLQLDVWQTWVRTVKMGRCYIERSHFVEACQPAGDGGEALDYMRRRLTVAEGLDMGSDYVTRDFMRKPLADPLGGDPAPVVVVCATTNLTAAYGTVDKPELKTATGSTAEMLPNGCEIWAVKMKDFSPMVTHLKDYPWVSQGIISITMVPESAIFKHVFLSQNPQKLNGGAGPACLYSMNVNSGEEEHVRVDIDFAGDVVHWIRSTIPERYRRFMKFACYPYAAIELTTYTATPIVLKPELFGSPALRVTQLSHAVPPNPRIMFFPMAYGDRKTQWGNFDDDAGEYLDMAVGISNLPTFSVLNNGYLSYMASSAHSIAYQYQAADWSQSKAQMAAQTAYSIAGNNIASSAAITNQNNENMGRQQHVRNIQNAANTGLGMVGSLAGGNILGAVTQGVSGYVNYEAGNALTQLSQQNASAINAIQMRAGNQNRDLNLELANATRRGDYQSAIAGINAKTQDARLIQPTTSGQVGGEAFVLAADQWKLVAKIKTIPDGAMRVIGEYWLRYGQAANVFARLPVDFLCMTHFTYWKCLEVTCTSQSCPESFRATLCGILEQGVTVWRNKAHIGNMDYGENRPLKDWSDQ